MKLSAKEREQRDAMIWLLFSAGVKKAALARLFELSVTTVGYRINKVAHRLARSSVTRPAECPDYWRRLSDAGALEVTPSQDLRARSARSRRYGASYGKSWPFAGPAFDVGIEHPKACRCPMLGPWCNVCHPVDNC